MHPLPQLLADLTVVYAVTGPFRYVPYLIIPLVLAAALIGLAVYLLRRTSKKSG